ncbi:hypothetical protein BH09BAC1_BH09BAC1_24560 [soil metagenome]
MKPIYLYLTLILVALSFASCEEKIDLDLDEIPPAIVITGRITNNPNSSYVRVTLSAPYLSDQSSLPVNDAVVILTEDGLISDTLLVNTGGNAIFGLPGYGGFYSGPLLQSGKIGSVYTLTVVYQGETYTASDTIRPIAAIDSLTYLYQESDRDGNGYFVSLNMQEPEGIGNFYQWRYIANNGYQIDLDQTASDEWVDGNYLSIQFDTPQQIGDTVMVEMASIGRKYYTFVTQLLNQESFGDLFDTPPANVRGNISNGAYGYWHADGAAADTIIIR